MLRNRVSRTFSVIPAEAGIQGRRGGEAQPLHPSAAQDSQNRYTLTTTTPLGSR